MQCEALVLRNLRFGDTSRVATLFTRELGKIGAIGKGVRDPRSPFGASLELLAHSTFVLYHRPGRDLQFLKSGVLEQEFREILRSPHRFLWGSALAEFLDRVLLEEQPAEELFQLSLRGFQVIETSPHQALPELFRALELRIAALLGYAPRLDECLSCGRPLPDEGEVWLFRTAEGGVLCPRCAAGSEPGGIRLAPRALRRVRSMVLGRGRAAAEGATIRESAGLPSIAWLRALDRLVEEFLLYHIETYRGLRSLAGRAAWEGVLDAPPPGSVPCPGDPQEPGEAG